MTDSLDHSDDPDDASVQADIERIGDAAVVVLHGTAEMATGEDIDQALHHAAQDATALIVDLDGLDFLGSTGLNLLVQVHHELEADQRELHVIAHHRLIRRPFELTGLDDVLHLHRSVDQAVAAIPPQRRRRLGEPGAYSCVSPSGVDYFQLHTRSAS